MKTERSVEIECPIEELFDYTLNNVAEWSLIVVEDEVIEKKPEGVGTAFRTVTEENGQRMEFAGVVTLHEPPTASASIMKGKQFDIGVHYQLEDLGAGRTRLTQYSVVKGKGFFGAMLFCFGWLMRKASCNALEKELENLKRLAEARKRIRVSAKVKEK